MVMNNMVVFGCLITSCTAVTVRSSNQTPQSPGAKESQQKVLETDFAKIAQSDEFRQGKELFSKMKSPKKSNPEINEKLSSKENEFLFSFNKKNGSVSTGKKEVPKDSMQEKKKVLFTFGDFDVEEDISDNQPQENVSTHETQDDVSKENHEKQGDVSKKETKQPEGKQSQVKPPENGLTKSESETIEESKPRTTSVEAIDKTKNDTTKSNDNKIEILSVVSEQTDTAEGVKTDDEKMKIISSQPEWSNVQENDGTPDDKISDEQLLNAFLSDQVSQIEQAHVGLKEAVPPESRKKNKKKKSKKKKKKPNAKTAVEKEDESAAVVEDETQVKDGSLEKEAKEESKTVQEAASEVKCLNTLKEDLEETKQESVNASEHKAEKEVIKMDSMATVIKRANAAVHKGTPQVKGDSVDQKLAEEQKDLKMMRKELDELLDEYAASEPKDLKMMRKELDELQKDIVNGSETLRKQLGDGRKHRREISKAETKTDEWANLKQEDGCVEHLTSLLAEQTVQTETKAENIDNNTSKDDSSSIVTNQSKKKKKRKPKSKKKNSPNKTDTLTLKEDEFLEQEIAKSKKAKDDALDIH